MAISNQEDFDLVIGILDRVLSVLVNFGRRYAGPQPRGWPLTDEENKQTLKHHAEDMIAAANKILKDIGKVEGTPQPEITQPPPVMVMTREELDQWVQSEYQRRASLTPEETQREIERKMREPKSQIQLEREAQILRTPMSLNLVDQIERAGRTQREIQKTNRAISRGELEGSTDRD